MKISSHFLSAGQSLWAEDIESHSIKKLPFLKLSYYIFIFQKMKTKNTCIKKSIFHHQNQDRVVTFYFIFLSHKSMSILARLGKHTGGKTTNLKRKNRPVLPVCPPCTTRWGGAGHQWPHTAAPAPCHGSPCTIGLNYGIVNLGCRKGHLWPLTDESIYYLRPLTPHNRVKLWHGEFWAAGKVIFGLWL